MNKSLGGDRLGSGKKMNVELHNYERSTHNLSKIWRSTMSAGTLVPCLSIVALPGDTFDINLQVDGKTHPTQGPLFGQYKVQIDAFKVPIRLYQAQLHNNALNIGMNMANIKLPFIRLTTPTGINPAEQQDPDNFQINPSCILSYLGIRGIGNTAASTPGSSVNRDFNAIPLLAYWDIYKNFYANKMENYGYVIHTPIVTLVETIDDIEFTPGGVIPGPGNPNVALPITTNNFVAIGYTGASPSTSQITFRTNQGNIIAETVLTNIVDNGVDEITAVWNFAQTGYITVYGWDYLDQADGSLIRPPLLQQFELEEIDTMRNEILAFATGGATPFNVNTQDLKPYNYLLNDTGGEYVYSFTQEGLGIKTYQSDMLNNWLNTETIDQVNAISAISTVGDEFTVDAFRLANKVNNMLNRIAVSGGTYDDWLDAVYTEDRYTRQEIPMYVGGLAQELVFQEVISNAATSVDATQPLGTLGGRGIMARESKGGQITVKIEEPCYIMLIASITPRIDYSQGNNWDVNLSSIDDLHKPAMDQIGFQDLITERMHWADTTYNQGGSVWEQHSAGKQPAWIEYMTAINEVRGNFAIKDNEMFMTLNRRYELDETTGRIKDLTTYIDPVKFNNSFAQTALDAQNFWIQIGMDITARRKISAKQIPNL